MTSEGMLSGFSLWAGIIVATLKLLDIFLGPKQKKVLAELATTAWLWLEDQRVGRFIALVRSTKAQRVLSILAHVSLIAILVSFLGRVFWGWQVQASLELGHPRLYESQVWSDVLATVLSMIFLTWKVHPRITAHIGAAPSLPRYFGRTAKCYGYCWLAALGLFLVQRPIYFLGEEPSQIEEALGGRVAVFVIHAITALISAPVVVELLLLQTLLFGSLYWVILVWVLRGMHAGATLIALRVAEHKDGPVLGLSALLVAVAALVKTFAGQ